MFISEHNIYRWMSCNFDFWMSFLDTLIMTDNTSLDEKPVILLLSERLFKLLYNPINIKQYIPPIKDLLKMCDVVLSEQEIEDILKYLDFKQIFINHYQKNLEECKIFDKKHNLLSCREKFINCCLQLDSEPNLESNLKSELESIMARQVTDCCNNFLSCVIKCINSYLKLNLESIILNTFKDMFCKDVVRKKIQGFFNEKNTADFQKLLRFYFMKILYSAWSMNKLADFWKSFNMEVFMFGIGKNFLPPLIQKQCQILEPQEFCLILSHVYSFLTNDVDYLTWKKDENFDDRLCKDMLEIKIKNFFTESRIRKFENLLFFHFMKDSRSFLLKCEISNLWNFVFCMAKKVLPHDINEECARLSPKEFYVILTNIYSERYSERLILKFLEEIFQDKFLTDKYFEDMFGKYVAQMEIKALFTTLNSEHFHELLYVYLLTDKYFEDMFGKDVAQMEIKALFIRLNTERFHELLYVYLAKDLCVALLTNKIEDFWKSFNIEFFVPRVVTTVLLSFIKEGLDILEPKALYPVLRNVYSADLMLDRKKKFYSVLRNVYSADLMLDWKKLEKDFKETVKFLKNRSMEFREKLKNRKNRKRSSSLDIDKQSLCIEQYREGSNEESNEEYSKESNEEYSKKLKRSTSCQALSNKIKESEDDSWDSDVFNEESEDDSWDSDVSTEEFPTFSL